MFVKALEEHVFKIMRENSTAPKTKKKERN